MAHDPSVLIPGKNPGEVYLPALGKTFQQVELRDHWLRFPHLEFEKGGPGLAHKHEDGSYFQRLAPGDEMVVVNAMYFRGNPTEDDNVILKLNRREIPLPKPVLRHAMGNGEQVNLLAEALVLLKGQLDAAQRRLVVIDAALEQGEGVENPTIKELVKNLITTLPSTVSSSPTRNCGFQFVCPLQVKDDDDIRVRNLTTGLLYLGGVAKSPVY